MATGRPSTSDLHPAAEALREKLVEELERTRIEAEEEPACARNILTNPDDYSHGALKSLKLELEGELEALLKTPLVQLPPDPSFLLGLAVEEAQKAALGNARTVEFYKKKVEELKEQKRKYETMLKRATAVNQTLEKLQSQFLTEEDKRVALERRHNRTSVLFRFLRGELHFILETYYPEEIATPESLKSMEDLLDCLVSKMMAEPNDPYVQIDDTMEEGHITLLLCANLIARHPTDITRIKFVDPRA